VVEIFHDDEWQELTVFTEIHKHHVTSNIHFQLGQIWRIKPKHKPVWVGVHKDIANEYIVLSAAKDGDPCEEKSKFYYWTYCIVETA
jgi:hypothetical protein